MLSDKTLIIVSFVLSFVGIIALYIILLVSELPLSDLTIVEKGHEAETVRVLGTVEKVRHGVNSSVTILTVSELVSRTAIVFDIVNVTPGQRLDLQGEIQMYEGKAELIVRSFQNVNESSTKKMRIGDHS